MRPGLIPPEEVAAAARRGLELREKFRRGGTSVGVRLARRLAERQPLGVRDIVSISGHLARHVDDAEARGSGWGDEANPSAGYVAFLLWGGEPGRRWSEGLRARLGKAAE